MNQSLRYFADLVERTVRTFIQAYLGAWLALGGADYDTLFTVHNLQVAVAAAALAVATALLAKGVNNPVSASVLPPQAQPPAPEPAATTTLPELTMDSGEARRQLDELLERLNRIPATRVDPPPPPTGFPPPRPEDRAPSGLDPNLVGGRDPNSDGNR